MLSTVVQRHKCGFLLDRKTDHKRKCDLKFLKSNKRILTFGFLFTISNMKYKKVLLIGGIVADW